MQPLCSVFGTILLLVLLPWSTTGQFQVTGPNEPLIAVVGKEAVLSCHLNPVMDAQNMEVKWYRNHSSGLVHHYGAFQDHTEHQMPEYQGRTEFLKENITKGQVALRIHSIRPFDGGQYRCFFESSTYYNDEIFEVLVTASGVVPRIHIEPGNTEEIKLTCTSTGWYPEPEVQWRNLQGQRLAPDSETKAHEGNGLFRVETSVTVNKSVGVAMSCHIRNLVLSDEKEVHISVADAFFPGNNLQTVAIAVLAVLVFLLAIATTLSAVYAVKTRRTKDSLKEEPGEFNEEQEPLNGHMVPTIAYAPRDSDSCSNSALLSGKISAAEQAHAPGTNSTSSNTQLFSGTPKPAADPTVAQSPVDISNSSTATTTSSNNSSTLSTNKNGPPTPPQVTEGTTTTTTRNSSSRSSNNSIQSTSKTSAQTPGDNSSQPTSKTPEPAPVQAPEGTSNSSSQDLPVAPPPPLPTAAAAQPGIRPVPPPKPSPKTVARVLLNTTNKTLAPAPLQVPGDTSSPNTSDSSKDSNTQSTNETSGADPSHIPEEQQQQ